jgi:hypothetical protein
MIMFRWIAANYRTFLWAFALAVAAWISAVTTADPDETRALSGVQVQVVGQDSNLVLSSPIPREVEVTLRAPRSVWEFARSGFCAGARHPRPFRHEFGRTHHGMANSSG